MEPTADIFLQLQGLHLQEGKKICGQIRKLRYISSFNDNITSKHSVLGSFRHWKYNTIQGRNGPTLVVGMFQQKEKHN